MMSPTFSELLLRDFKRDLERRFRSASARHRPAASPAVLDEAVVLRLCTVHDGDALGRLEALEDRRMPKGGCVVAEVDGVVAAALPFEGGGVFADPFRPTAHLVPLLELRAAQLSDAPSRRRRRALRGRYAA
jgi:hypothetical protein